MITVIIAGGSGTRLWPLSTPEYPKHLLTVVGKESLLQGTYRRAKILGSTIYVVTDGSHAHHVREQLKELSDESFIIEPARRGTANCILAGLRHIRQRHDADEPIAFIGSDHFIRDTEGFAHSFHVAAEATTQEKKLTLVGVEPTYPATGFGYIHKAEAGKDENIHGVQAFKEKPEFDLAQQYLLSGEYLWNCNYFIASLNTFLSVMDQYNPGLRRDYDRLCAATTTADFQQAYLCLKPDAIDYALLERAKDLLVVPASFDWIDLGSFADVHKVVPVTEEGNHAQGQGIELDQVENSFIRNEEPGKPIAVIGLDNVVVVNTPHGLLVTRKDLSQKVGDIAKKIQAQQQS